MYKTSMVLNQYSMNNRIYMLDLKKCPRSTSFISAFDKEALTST